MGMSNTLFFGQLGVIPDLVNKRVGILGILDGLSALSNTIKDVQRRIKNVC